MSVKKKDNEDTELEGFVDLIKLLDEQLEEGSSLVVKKKLSLDDHFADVLEEAELYEKTIIDMMIEKQRLEEGFQEHARRTRGRRRRRPIEKASDITPATLTSLVGVITSGAAGNIILNGTDFGTDPVTTNFAGGATSGNSVSTPNGSGTQTTTAIPAVTYGLGQGIVVSITLTNGSGTPSNALTTTVQPPGFSPAPHIDSIAGDIQNATPTSLVLTGTHFISGPTIPVTVRFTIGAVDTDVTVTPSSAEEITVAVPAAVYNEPVSTLVGIKVIRSGIPSNTIAKTIIA